MSILYKKLPCAQNFLRLKKLFRESHLKQNSLLSVSGKQSNSGSGSLSPSRQLASPSMLKRRSSFANRNKKKMLDSPTHSSNGSG
jgi:hypothetical protein